MKKQFLIVMATAAAMLIGLGGLVAIEGSEIVIAVPGSTVIKDLEGDLLLRNCDTTSPEIPCSLPPGEAWDPPLPGYFDIKEASINQSGRKWVDLSISLYEPIPAVPSYPYVSYSWAFEGGCIKTQPPTLGISIQWKDWGAGTWEWRANWVEITSCADPRAIEIGLPVPFKFTKDGVKVRVALSDLLTAADETGTLIWHAAVRRVPFIYTIDATSFRTVAVDYAPDVLSLVDPSPFIAYPEVSATWEPR
jgi:hypothetical protein